MMYCQSSGERMWIAKGSLQMSFSPSFSLPFPKLHCTRVERHKRNICLPPVPHRPYSPLWYVCLKKWQVKTLREKVSSSSREAQRKRVGVGREHDSRGWGRRRALSRSLTWLFSAVKSHRRYSGCSISSVRCWEASACQWISACSGMQPLQLWITPVIPCVRSEVCSASRMLPFDYTDG